SRLDLLYVDVPALRPGTIGAYLLALVSVGVATALRLVIDPYVEGLQFATFLPAVIITTLIGGYGAGLFSVVLSVAAAALCVLALARCFLVPPLRLSFIVSGGGVVRPLSLPGGVFFCVVPLVGGVVLGQARRGARRAAPPRATFCPPPPGRGRLGRGDVAPRH